MLYKIYNSQNPPASREVFLDAAEIIAHEHNFYAILRPDVFHEGADCSQPLDQELVAEYLYAIDQEDYYELEEAQEGKSWYIPPRETFLKYADEYYIEKTPQLLALADYLSNTQRRLHCPPMEIAEEMVGMFRMDTPLQHVIDDVQRLGVRFQSQEDFRAFLELSLELNHHVRRYSSRGHTAAELGLQRIRIEEAMKEATFDRNYQDPFANMVAAMNGNIMGATTISGKPAKNAPCPCGSGRKYKNCCGKGK